MFYDKYMALCNAKNIKPTVAAIRMGLSNATPTAWANGSPPRPKTIAKIAEFFNVPLEFFYDDALAREILAGMNVGEAKKKPGTPDARRARLKQMIDMAANEEELRRLEQAVLAVLFAPPGEAQAGQSPDRLSDDL